MLQTVAQIKEKMTEVENRFLDVEMAYMSGDVTLKVYRTARMRRKLTIDTLHYNLAKLQG